MTYAPTVTSREIAAVGLVVTGAGMITAAATVAFGTAAGLAAAGATMLGGGVLLGLGSPPPAPPAIA